MTRWFSSQFAGCDIAEDVVIECDEAVIGEGTRIEPGVRIAARKVEIGAGSRIERGSTVRGLGSAMERFSLGDQSMIGFDTQILAPEFRMGDYGQLHNSGLHSGYRPLTLGHNCWVGQNSILNCTELLTIGNNVRIGTQSQLWTHVASGELLEGCTLFGEHPLTLEDNVWIVGGAVISPGLVLARNSIVMTGSVLTRSTEPFHTYAGVPARDVTDKLFFWKPRSIEDKIESIREYIQEFVCEFPQHGRRIYLFDDERDPEDTQAGDVRIVAKASDWREAKEKGVSLFDLTSKTYLKQRSAVEIDWIRWTVGFRARFLPREN